MSTVKVALAGVMSRFPAASVARTSKVCWPSLSVAAVCGELQSAKAWPSKRHSKLASASLEANSNVGVSSALVADGPVVIVVCGGAVSMTLKLRLAGVGSVLPAASVPRTSYLCRPGLTALVVCGEVHDAKGSPSTRHSKLDPASSALNANVGVSSSLVGGGPAVIVVSGGVVSGGVVSTVKAREAGDESVLPAASVARTAKVCWPSLNVEVVCGEV
ncbi:MAG: hypothetical protein WKF96_23990, partial [Solirubrobacteraceae bacterium]